MTRRPVRTDTGPAMADYRRFPGSRLLLIGVRCGWAKAYDPERVIDRLRTLRAGGRPFIIA